MACNICRYIVGKCALIYRDRQCDNANSIDGGSCIRYSLAEMPSVFLQSTFPGYILI